MSADAKLVQSMADVAMHLPASDSFFSNDLVQDDQHAMNIDAAAAVEAPAQPIAYLGPEWDPGAVQDYIDHCLPEYEEHFLDPLLQAAAAGNMPVLQQQLAALGSSAHGADGSGWTALHAAADSGQECAVELLLAAGADVNAVAAYDPDEDWDSLHQINISGQGDTPFLLAVLAGHTAVVQQLLAAGADVHAADIDGCTALHIAAEAGDSHLVQLLLDAGAHVNVVNADNESPLHLAAEQGDVDILRQLLAAGAAADEAGGDCNATPLHHAALQGQLSTARELLAAGADATAEANMKIPFIPPHPDPDDLTPLQLAARHGHPDVVLLLLSGAHTPAAQRADELSRALCDAVAHGNLPCASLLIAAGALATAEQQRQPC